MPRARLLTSGYDDEETVAERKTRLQREEEESVEARRLELAKLDLLDFIAEFSPHLKRPEHMVDLCQIFERISVGEMVRALCSYPIRHWKTQTMLHAMVWLWCKDPAIRFVLMTFDHSRAETLGKWLIDLSDRAGVGGERGKKTIREWFNKWGGGVHVMSADQSSEGADCHILLFDDPLSDKGARLSDKRDMVDDAIAYYTLRCLRNGKRGSVVGVASRFHPEDPIGRRLERYAVQWEYLHKPAILDEGTPDERAFAPAVLSLDELQAIKAEAHEKDPSDFDWLARYMGDPQVLSGNRFRELTEYWREVPPYSYRLAYGADLAFTAGEGSDYFALVVGKAIMNKLYILDVQRHKLEAHMIESTCKAAVAQHGRGPFFSYMSGPERGTAAQMRHNGLPFVPMQARYSKLVRAETTIRRWNAGQIVLPEDAPWLSGFLARLQLFTGEEKSRNDDEIDALVSLCDGILGSALGSSAGPKSLGRAYPGMLVP